jgi:hypothetical protein
LQHITIRYNSCLFVTGLAVQGVGGRGDTTDELGGRREPKSMFHAGIKQPREDRRCVFLLEAFSGRREYFEQVRRNASPISKILPTELIRMGLRTILDELDKADAETDKPAKRGRRRVQK